MHHIFGFHNHHGTGVFKAAVDLALGIFHMNLLCRAPHRMNPEVKNARPHAAIKGSVISPVPQKIIENPGQSQRMNGVGL